MIPLDAAAPGEGKLGFTLRVPVGVVGAISPFNFPLNLVAHKVAPAIAAGCPVVLKPASQTPLLGHHPGRDAARRVRSPARPPERGDRQRRHGRQRDRRRPRHRAHHVHRFARGRLGDQGPGAAQEGRPRARQQRARDHRARRRLARPRRTRSRSPGSAMPASRASRPNASTCIEPLVDDFTAGLAERVRTLVVGDPLDEATDVSALISTRRARAGRVVDRGGDGRREPRSWSAARSVPTACSCRRCSPT